MKKLFALIAAFGMLFMGASIFAQDEPMDSPATEDTTQVAETPAAVPTVTEAPAVEEGGLRVLHTTLKTKFIEGGAGFMGLTNIKNLTHEMENILGKIRSREMVPNAEITNILLLASDALVDLINNIHSFVFFTDIVFCNILWMPPFHPGLSLLTQ